jgi:hypothetical protein
MILARNYNPAIAHGAKWLPSDIAGIPLNLPGNTYYVSRNVTSSGDGLSWDNAFKTIGEAIAVVNANYTAAAIPSKGRNQVIYIGEGWYSEVPLTLTASDTYIIGVAPGNHDSTVLYGSATAGGYDSGSGAAALKITGSNNTLANFGVFNYDSSYAAIQNGALAGANYGNRFVGLSFVRDVADGEKYGILDYGADGTRIDGCFFSTSCKDAGIWSASDGVVNPVNLEVFNNRFVGTPIGVQINAGHNADIESNSFFDDTSDRPDVVDYPIVVSGTAFCFMNRAMTTKANLITGGGTINDIGNYGSDSST